ncbi:MAG: radical SAM protein [Deltaproteobacteria bacterium]|nr:radical SAM protein [Deltaproteobacteria bacterium]
MNPDILLINPGGSRKRIYQELSKDYSAVDTPFWAILTAGYLRKEGFSVGVLDANAENIDYDETVERIQRDGPKYIAIICYSQQANVSTPIMVGVGELCRKIKEKIPEKNLILTGWHPSALPERTLMEEACDFVIQGEGFYSLKDLLSGNNYREVRGLWWEENGEIKSNRRAENIADLTRELSEAAWDLLPMNENRYRAFNWMCLGDLNSRNRFVSLFTSLGCPFRCNFCAIHATYGEHKLRSWNPEWVIGQFDLLVNKYNIKNINLHDELFIFKHSHYHPIAKEILEHSYDLNIASFARVDILDKTSIKELTFLKKAGFNWFKLGIESCNEEIIKHSNKGNFTKDIIRRVVKKVHDAGIDLCANFMFGLPGDTIETMQENLEFALELKCAFPSFFCTMAIPGSDLYRIALKNNTPLPESWLGYASQGYDFLPLPTESLSAAEILRFRDHVFNTYFTNQDYLSLIEKKFGKESREHIKGMTDIRLKRKILGD